MDRKDEEMRDVIYRLWSMQAKKLGEHLVPPRDRKSIFHKISSFYFEIKLNSVPGINHY